MGNPAEVVQNPAVASKNFRNPDKDKGWAIGETYEPLAAALTVAGTECVDPGGFRILGEHASLLCPLVG